MRQDRATGQVRQTACSFDRIARVYRLLEYASFGRALERTRQSYLSELRSARHALVLGDGDGRFLAALLDANQELAAVAMDSSPRMLELLRERCHAAGERLTTRLVELSGDASEALSDAGQGAPFDLVVTHFFLDCLTEPEMEALVQCVRPCLSPSARWIVSEFGIPAHGFGRLLGRMLIPSLYAAFRMLTGLRVRQIPEYGAGLRRAGFVRRARQLRLGGLLVAELWQMEAGPALECGCESSDACESWAGQGFVGRAKC